MGQYYKFMNLDKKEICERNRSGYKLMEHSYLGNYYCDDILNLLSNRWRGDRVIHVGDYAMPNDPTSTAKLIDKVSKEFNIEYSLYNYADSFNEVSPFGNKNIRYVYNLNKKEYVDLYKQPIQWCHYTDDLIHCSKINSFALLIGCGNKQGGGDYYGVNSNSVGSWAGDKFVSSESPLQEYKKFKEVNLLFNELSNDYSKIKKYDKFSFNKILSNEIKIFDSFLEDLKKHNINISKCTFDDSGLTKTEKEKLNEVFDKQCENNKELNIYDLR